MPAPNWPRYSPSADNNIQCWKQSAAESLLILSNCWLSPEGDDKGSGLVASDSAKGTKGTLGLTGRRQSFDRRWIRQHQRLCAQGPCPAERRRKRGYQFCERILRR